MQRTFRASAYRRHRGSGACTTNSERGAPGFYPADSRELGPVPVLFVLVGLLFGPVHGFCPRRPKKQ